MTSGLAFLHSNNITTQWEPSQIHDLAVKVATSELTKEEIAQLLLLISKVD